MDVSPAIRAVPPSHYQAYLNSPSWRLRRNTALKDSGWRCQRCPAKRNLQVHHRTYERLGAERDADLEVLCENCHRDEHLEHPEQTSIGLYLKIVSGLLGRRAYSSVTDLADDMKRECVRLKVPIDVLRINDAIAVVCGNRLTSVRHARHQEQHAHIPEHDRPMSHAEAHEALALLGPLQALVQAGIKTMPSHQARDERTHTAMLAEQVAEYKASRRLALVPKRVPLTERLEAIFAERWE